MTDPDMEKLDKMLARAAAAPVQPDDKLMARVMADAQVMQPKAATPPRGRSSRWSDFVAMIGGWPAMGGLATAGIAGLWIGVAPPATLENLAADWLGTTQIVDLGGANYDLQDVFDG